MDFILEQQRRREYPNITIIGVRISAENKRNGTVRTCRISIIEYPILPLNSLA